MIIFFIYTHDLIQKGVKLETSYLAENRKRQESGDMIEELIMDEQHDILFRRLFNQAHAEVISKLSVTYLSGTPTDLEPVFREFPDFRQDRDFSLFLNMHADFPMQYKKSIEIKIEQYLIDFICYRWLETKSPTDAASYFQRLKPTLDEIKLLLIRKLNPPKLRPSFP